MADGMRAPQAFPTLHTLVDIATDRLGRVPRSLHQLLFRLAIASVFLPAGLLKIASWQSTIALFQDEYKVPLLPPVIAATMVTVFELGCSSLLIAGLGTRLATLPLVGQIVTVQLFVYPQALHEHLVWGTILLFLLTRGGGTISADHLLYRWFTRQPS